MPGESGQFSLLPAHVKRTRGKGVCELQSRGLGPGSEPVAWRRSSGRGGQWRLQKASMALLQCTPFPGLADGSLVVLLPRLG